MNRTIAFEVKINGIRGLVTNQNDLTAAIRETNKAYKTSDFGSKEREEAKRQLAQLKTVQKSFAQDVRDTAREQQIAADKGQRSYRALNAELVNLRRSYKELSEDARNSIGGRQQLAQIQRLDKELKEIDKTIGQNQRNVGDYQQAFADLGGVDLGALLTVPGAIAAVGTAAIAAGGYVIDMTENVRELRGSLQNLTGETGEELDALASRVLSISETFETTTDEVTNAANAVANGLGISFEDALGRIEEGFIAGSDQTDEFLSNLLEYPTQFQTVFGQGEAAADAFFKVLNQQATQGIFNDKAVDTVKEAGLALRELPKVTRDALEAIGLDSDKIAEEISENGVGAGIAIVAKRLGELEANSPEVGQAIADIFKGAGEDAGLDFIVSLQNIGEETGSLIDTSNEYQLQQQETLRVNREFAEEQVRLANTIGGTGATLDNLLTKGQTLLIKFFIPIIQVVQRLYNDNIRPLVDELTELGIKIGLISEEGTLLEGVAKALGFALDVVATPAKILVLLFKNIASEVNDLIDLFNGLIGATEDTASAQGEVEKASRNMGRGNRAAREELAKQNKESAEAAKRLEDQKKATDELRESTAAAAVVTDTFAKGSLAELNKQLSGLKKELNEASGDEVETIVSDIVDIERNIEEVEKARTEIRNAIVRAKDDFKAIDLLDSETVGADLEIEIPAVITTPDSNAEILQEAADEQERINERLNEKILENNEYTARRSKEVAVEEAREAASTTAAIVAEAQSVVFDGINAALDTLTESSQARQQRDVQAVEQRYEAEIEAAEGNAERQEELREELAEATAEIERREFERQKKIRTAAALTSLAEGVVNILSAPSTIPDPAGTIFKGVRIGILTATTAAQIANIQRQQIAAKGALIDGVFRGESHSGPNGGIDTIINGQPVKVEGGEGLDVDEFGGAAIINLRSRAAFAPTLNKIRGLKFPGKRRMLSSINSYRGYGVPFAADGMLVKPSGESISTATNVTVSNGQAVSAIMSPEVIQALADRVGQAVFQGSAQGVKDGMTEASIEQNRQERLKSRTAA